MLIIEYIDNFLELFPKLTKEEAELIEEVVNWNGEQKAAYKMAKKIFDEEQEES